MTNRLSIPRMLTVLCLVALGAFACLAPEAKFHSDDYCQAVDAYHYGPIGSAVNTYENWNGRYTQIALSSVVYLLFGETSSVIMPLVVVFGLTAAAWFLLRGYVQYPLLLASAAIFALISGAPDIWETFYWTPGIITYSIPIICLLVLARLLLASYVPGSRKLMPFFKSFS